MAGGNENVQLRMRYAVRQSELTSSRKEVHQLLMGSLPFVIADVPRDLDEWGVEELIESKASSERMLESLEFLLVNKLCKSRNRLMRAYPSTVKEIRFFTTIQEGFRFPPFHLRYVSYHSDFKRSSISFFVFNCFIITHSN